MLRKVTAEGRAVEREDGGGQRVGTDHVEDEARVITHTWQAHQPRQHLRGGSYGVWLRCVAQVCG